MLNTSIGAEPASLQVAARSVDGAIAMLFVQPVHLCERDSHSGRVVVFNAIKRETDERVAYFRSVGFESEKKRGDS